ncbi:MAG: flagellar hook-length control protein FliK [Pseudomonadota bacterium]
MNAGLLGEHLASPRTATKTNQSTALDTRTADNGGPSDQSGFASYVARDTEPSSSDAKQTKHPAEAPGASDAGPDPTLPGLTIEPDAQAEILTPTAPPETDSADAPVLAVASETADINTAPIQAQADDGVALTLDASANRTDIANADADAPDPRAPARAETANVAIAADSDTAKLAERTDRLRADATSQPGDPAEAEPAADLNKSSRVDIGRSEAELARGPAPAASSEQAAIAQTDARQALTAETSALDRTGLGGVPRDVTVVAADPVVSIATGSTPSTAAPVATGLTPTAPAIPVAMPNDLTGIIVNALNNGIDPQEQLVVQLDPPELGRVMIDFKFDAQGLQQIVVTSENPEALKRLRELHFELTQALREHGLSEQNMSFQQHADGPSQDTWTSSEPDGRDMQFTAAADRRASPSATPTAPRVQPRDRLDLLL